MRYVLVAEATICFAPALVILLVGVLMVPVWLGILGWSAVSSALGAELGKLGAFVTVGLLILVAAGIAGIVGIVRVIRALVRSPSIVVRVRQTRAFSIVGTAAIFIWVAVHLGWGHTTLGLLGLPPLLAAGHILLLARRLLFPNGLSITSSAA